MVAQSVSRGVRSLMRTLYNTEAAREAGEVEEAEEEERRIESPPAKRRRVGTESAGVDEEQNGKEPAARAQHSNTIGKRLSSRARRSRNYTDHDGNEWDGAKEDVSRDSNGNDVGIAKASPRQNSPRTRTRNKADHDKITEYKTLGNADGTGEVGNGQSVVSSDYSGAAARRSTRGRNTRDVTNFDGNGKLKSVKDIARNNELSKGDSPRSAARGDATQRLSSRNRNKRNNADHVDNEEDGSDLASSFTSDVFDTRYAIKSKGGSDRGLPSIERRRQRKHTNTDGDEREEDSEHVFEERTVGQLSARDRRRRNHTDHHGNEDGSPGDHLADTVHSPCTPTKRSKRQHHDARQIKYARSDSRMLPEESSTNMIAKSRGSHSGVQNREINGTNNVKVIPDSKTSIIQSSPSNAGSKNKQSRTKGRASLKALENSPLHLNKNDQRSPFVFPEKHIRSKSHESELFANVKVSGFMRKVLRDRTTCNRSTKLIGIDAEYQKIYRLVEQTVIAGEGNSVLLIGARGCGKSAIVCKALEEVSRENSQAFYIIKLNGFFLTDDRLALREIWRQLGQEMEVEDETSGKNYADTLSKLLALLSHCTETEDGGLAASAQKSVIFIMEEFDQFTAHPRQTLLYNLFDVAQSRKAPIAVIGMTTRIDIAESMEKRVKSRFSHRYIHVPLAKDYNTFKAICRANLECTSENLSPQELMQLSSVHIPAWKMKKGQEKAFSDFLENWNSRISKLLDEPTVKGFIQQKYETSKSAPDAINALAASMFDSGNMSSSTKGESGIELLGHFNPPESKLVFLPYLPTLALALLIAAARLDIVLDTDTVNFSMVYDEYSNLAGKARIASAAGGAVTAGASTKIWSREVAIKQWDRLVNYGFLLPIQGTVAPFGMYRVDVALEEIAPSIPDMDRVLEKWCKQI